MRVFAGIEFSREVREAISHMQINLKKLCGRGRWKHKDNFHLTLKFLGEVSDEEIPRISAALERSVKGMHPFSLEFSGLGRFKGRNSIRVLWLGFSGDTEALGELKRSIESQMHSEGFERDNRRFSPHVTIAQDIETGNSFGKLREYAEEFKVPPVDVRDVVLFRSEQIGRKRVYTPVQRFYLTGD